MFEALFMWAAQHTMLRMSACRAKEFPHVRYDSVCGIHTTDNTPIYITYNEARAYPKYLITYK